MTDIELVIKIPEEIRLALINNIQLSSDQQSLCDSCINHAIINGIPLPKGHGRLGDLDVLETEMVNGINAGNYEEGYETFAHINNMDDLVECVRYADTIIEADKENNNIFEKMTEEEQTFAWMFMIFNKDKITEKTEQWTKEAEEAGMTLTEYLESISPLNNKKSSWLGKNCKDCCDKKCKELGTLHKGYDCALWQGESEDRE